MGLLLVLMFLVVPVVEIYVIVQVGQEIGALPTVVLLLLESLLGAWLVRREGRRAWLTLKGAVTSGQLPSRELADAALVLIGGTLLLTPGFVTDVVGFVFVLPLTRPAARRALAGFVARRATVTARTTGTTRPGPGPRVVPGQVVDGGKRPPDDESPGRATGG